MSVLFAHLGVFRVKLRHDRHNTSIKRKCERAREKKNLLVLRLGIKMNCVFAKDMDHCRRQPETLCYRQREGESVISCVFLTTVTNCDRKLCVCVYRTLGYVRCVFISIEPYIMNQITLIFIVFLRVKTKGHGFVQMNRAWFCAGREKKRACMHTFI